MLSCSRLGETGLYNYVLLYLLNKQIFWRYGARAIIRWQCVEPDTASIVKLANEVKARLFLLVK